jgi:hypothetical protein
MASGGEQQRVVAVGGVGVGDDLAVVVDRGRVADLVAGTGRMRLLRSFTVPPLSIEDAPTITDMSST